MGGGGQGGHAPLLFMTGHTHLEPMPYKNALLTTLPVKDFLYGFISTGVD